MSSVVMASNSYKGYLLDNNGNIVTTPYGECVKSGSWANSAAQPKCDESLKSNAIIDYKIKKIIEHSGAAAGDVLGALQQVIDDLKLKQGLEQKDNGKLNSNDLLCDQDHVPENGDGEHQYRAAIALLSGLCKPEVSLKPEVKMLLKESISYGHASAMNVYGYLLIDGSLLGYQDAEHGITYFNKAAEHNETDALYNLGFAYQYGVGVAIDAAKSNEYFARSGGIASSLFRLKRHDGNTEAHLDHVEDLVESWESDGSDNEQDLLDENDTPYENNDAIATPEDGSLLIQDRFIFPYIKN